jgi:hypothetical protein
VRGARDLGESGKPATAPHSWLGEEQLAASGHLRICHGDYDGGSPGQGREKDRRNGGRAWAEKFSRFTRSFEAFGVQVLRAARSLSDACQLLSISWDQAHCIMERAVARGLERRSLEELEAVGNR